MLRRDLRKSVLLKMVQALRTQLDDLSDDEVIDLVLATLDKRKHVNGDRRAVYPDLRLDTPIEYMGVEYDSVRALCDARNVGYQRGLTNLRMGRGVDAGRSHRRRPGKHQRPQPVTIEGVEYPSLTAASKATGIAISTLSAWKRKGILEQKLAEGRQNHEAVPIRVNGRRYPSLSSAAMDLGVSTSAMSRWHKEGVLEEKLKEREVSE